MAENEGAREGSITGIFMGELTFRGDFALQIEQVSV